MFLKQLLSDRLMMGAFTFGVTLIAFFVIYTSWCISFFSDSPTVELINTHRVIIGFGLGLFLVFIFGVMPEYKEYRIRKKDPSIFYWPEWEIPT